MPSVLPMHSYKLLVEYKNDHPLVLEHWFQYDRHGAYARRPKPIADVDELPKALLIALIDDFMLRFDRDPKNRTWQLLFQAAYINGDFVIGTQKSLDGKWGGSVFVGAHYTIEELGARLGADVPLMASASRVAAFFQERG